MSTVEPGLQILGYGALLLSCIAFGTMFVPLRKRNCRDGFFVQWIECGVVFIVGCIFYAARGFPTFQPAACIGGLLYATGNVFSVPIVEGIGMGIGFLIWTSLQIIVGWGVARFGLFGLIAAQDVKSDVLNYIGIVMTIISGVLLIFVKQEVADETPSEEESSGDKSGQESGEEEEQMTVVEAKEENRSKTEIVRKIPFIIMAMVLACLHGLMMAPIDYLKQHNPSRDPFHVFDYIFPFYTSVFLFSTAYFFAYCAVRRHAAVIDGALVLPSIGYGLLWTAGMTLWFVSSDKLSQVVAYPCTARLPPLISALLDVFVFRTIRGTKNYIFLTISLVIGVVSVILLALSNQI